MVVASRHLRIITGFDWAGFPVKVWQFSGRSDFMHARHGCVQTAVNRGDLSFWHLSLADMPPAPRLIAEPKNGLGLLQRGAMLRIYTLGEGDVGCPT